MLDDMFMRKLSTKTQIGYIRAVARLADYLKHSPASASAEELRLFQLYLVKQGTSNITLNATLTGLRFFFCKTLNRADVVGKLSTVPVPRKLPTVLSYDEVKRLIAATNHMKYRMALSLAYGAGLRISEVAGLKVTDIDRERMVLRSGTTLNATWRAAVSRPVRRLTNRNWGVSMHYQLFKISQYLRGWINYFGIANGYQRCVDLDHLLGDN
jgi:site-specific recombinase XerD